MRRKVRDAVLPTGNGRQWSGGLLPGFSRAELGQLLLPFGLVGPGGGFKELHKALT